ncbi:Uncharacterised protein [Mycobacterium tuberculosis]|nr:Uncharacterised protein [Mycobacterium tuberculosis]COX30538.1 Uncharacterised protein [Mycobacterium tuberculosis]
MCDDSISPLACARSTNPRASVTEIPSAAATSLTPSSWVSDIMSRVSRVGSSRRRSRSMRATLAACAGACALAETA